MITHERFNLTTGEMEYLKVTPKQKAALWLAMAIKTDIDAGIFEADMTDSESDAVQRQLERFEKRILAMLEPTLRSVK